MPTDRGRSRTLMRALRNAMAGAGDGQQRLDKVVRLVAVNMVAEVCSIYLKRDDRTLELCATEGLEATSVHSARLLVGQGLVGRIAEQAAPINTDDAENEPGFRYLPETGEERFRSFMGVPIQRQGEVMGVLVVQNEVARQYDDEDVETLETVAMVIAEMTEAGAFLGSEGLGAGYGRRTGAVRIHGRGVGEGTAVGPAHLHEPRLIVVDPIGQDPETERAKLAEAMEALRDETDRLFAAGATGADGEHTDIFDAYRMFAKDKGWNRRLQEAIDSGLSAAVAVEKVQSTIRSQMARATVPYLRERLHDLDDLANRLLRHLAPGEPIPELPDGAVLVARNLGPAEVMEHAARISGIVLEEGSPTAHASIVARALGLPMVVRAGRVTRDTNPGDQVVIDGDKGRIYLRPDSSVLDHYSEKLALARQVRDLYRAEVHLPAQTLDGHRVALKMNAGVLADLPSLVDSGAEGVGLYRTELQFMIRTRMPKREQQRQLYARIINAAEGREVIFRTLDIGSDKLLPYMQRDTEPNPAMGMRAIRVGLDRPRLFRMQMQSLIRAAEGRPLSVMFPMVAEAWEYFEARAQFEAEVDRLARHGHPRPDVLNIGLMFEVPALIHAPDRLFAEADFISVGGNDLMQFFFAADRENESVWRLYDMLNLSFLAFLERIAQRCAAHGTRLSFCGEAVSRPAEALALAAIGYREFSLQSAAIGPIKHLLRQTNLAEIRAIIDRVRAEEQVSARAEIEAWLASKKF